MSGARGETGGNAAQRPVLAAHPSQPTAALQPYVVRSRSDWCANIRAAASWVGSLEEPAAV